MRTAKLRKGLMVLCICLSPGLYLSGQGAMMEFIYGGIDDAEKILQAYLEPYANILGADLNAGWYNTARPHQLGGLDLTASVSWAKAPASMLSFDVSGLDLTGQLVPGGTSLAPTVAGSMDDRPVLSYAQSVDMGGGNMQEIEYARFTLPNGAGVDFFPMPMIQLSVGLPLGTDVSVRFIPMLQIREYGEIGLWGVGGRHSVSQWIPAIRELEFLDIALQGGYTRVNTHVNVDVEPLPDYVDVAPEHPADIWHDQKVIQVVGGWTTNVIASQTFSVLTIYEGIGYASSLVEMALQGHYPVHTVIDEPGPDLGKLSYEIVEDPVSLEFSNINNLRYNIGARLKFGGFTMHYDFTYTLYATHSVGIGISFR